MKFWEKYSAITLVTFCTLLYTYFAYFLERNQFDLLLVIWILLFVFSYYLIKNKHLSFKKLIWVSIFFRLLFLFSIPNLSQDFYRFIWDGRMILEGFNPYLSLPKIFIEQGNYPIHQAIELYQGMGNLNGSNFTNYPPINQFCFLIAALFSSKSIFGSVVTMRVLLIMSDIGILYFGKKLLEKLKIHINTIFLYALNPFVIIELTGNLHFEPVMLFFLIWSLYLLHQRKWIWAAILVACSVSVKLIPLLFLPLFYQFFIKNEVSYTDGFKKLILFYSIIIATIILLFLPFYSTAFLNNYTESVGLWFRSFEFNASFYYLAREIGYLFRGWNEIAIIGKIIPIVSILFIIAITFFRKNVSLEQLITAFLFALSFYYFTTTTMHPWYLATLVLLSIFTKYRFPIVWSFVIIVSYQVYETTPWKENLWLIVLEYLIVYCFFLWELKKEPLKLL